MSARVRPYKGAWIEYERTVDSVAQAGNAGRLEPGPCRLRIRLYRDVASKGFRSDYAPIPTRWLELVALDCKGRTARNCWAFSGSRFESAVELFHKNVADAQRFTAEAAAPQG